ncbi:MAG: phosphatase PAP2 family protein [Verrucomicrobiota bacterium]|nr:phosphatase PAP2 family protein [Verrucomicrobiota bacterium]
MYAPAPLPSLPVKLRSWRQQLLERWCTLWLLKLVGISGGMGLFFAVYFWVLNHPLGTVTTMPTMALDELIPFRSGALGLYLSLWVYVSLVPALTKNFRELGHYGLAALILSLLGLGIFFIWPTAVPITNIDWTLYPSIAFLKTHDASGNACPSLHVAFAVLSAFWFERIIREIQAPGYLRVLNWLWCLGIIYSTIATRQHVVLDALAGALLGTCIAVIATWRHAGAPSSQTST